MQQMQQQSPTQDASKAMIGAAEASRVLHCDVTTVQRWARAGKLPVALKMPGATGALLFDRADVEALAAELVKEPAA